MVHMSIKTRPDNERFNQYVEPEPNTGCFIWTGALNIGGYGKFGKYISTRKMKTVAAHRFAYEMANGAIPDGKVICHKCNNRLCVNPDHLYAGTQLANMADAIRAGTHISLNQKPLRGEKHPSAKLTNEQAQEMRRLFSEGITKSMLARKYGVANNTVHYVITGKSYS
jgi:hypothetical protein